MSSTGGEGFRIPVDAEIRPRTDVARVREAANRIRQGLGRPLAQSVTREFQRGMAQTPRIVREAFAGPTLQATTKQMEDLLTSTFRRSRGVGEQEARRMAQAHLQAARTISGSQGIGGAVRQGTRQASVGANEFIRTLEGIERTFRNMPGVGKAAMQAVAADLNQLRSQLSKTIVDEQSQQQIVRTQRELENRLAQERRAAERRRLAQERSAAREREQERQVTGKRLVNAEKEGLRRVNIETNAALQKQLIEERGQQQRRTALQRAFLDNLNRMWRGSGSAGVNAIRSNYQRMTQIVRSSESQMTTITRQGVSERRNATVVGMRQTTAAMQAEMGTMMAAQQQMRAGVLGTVTGMGAGGIWVRRLFMGGVAGLGVKQLFSGGADLQEELRVTNALLQTTDDQAQRLRDTAVALGNDLRLPGVSGANAAEAIGLMAKAGFEVEDAIGSAFGVLSLARGNMLDAADAAEIVAKSMTAFSLEGEQATIVADSFSGALALAPQSINELKDAVAAGGGVFNSLYGAMQDPKDTLDQFLGTVTELVKTTGQGTAQLGTGLKVFLQRLGSSSAPVQGALEQITKSAGELGTLGFRADGSIRPWIETVDILRRGYANLNTEQEKAELLNTAFGTRGAAIAAGLVSADADIAGSIAEVVRLGDATALAEARSAGARGALDAFTSQIQTYGELIYEILEGPMEGFLRGLSTMIDTLVSGEGVWPTVRRGLLGAAAGLTAIIAARAAVQIMQVLRTVMIGLTSPMGLVGIGIAGLGAALFLLYDRVDPVREVIQALFGQLRSLGGQLRSAIGPAIRRFADRAVDGITRVGEAFSAVFGLLLTGDFSGAFSRIFGVTANAPIVGFLLGVRDTVISVFDVVSDVIGNVVRVVGEGLSAVGDFVTGFDIGTVFSTIGDAFARLAEMYDGSRLQEIVQGIGEFAVGVFDAIGSAAGRVVDFFFAGVAAIENLGLFEGLREIVLFPLRTLGNLISTAFSAAFGNINWGLIGFSILGGLFATFRFVGRTITSFITSDEFVGTIVTALALAATIIGTAAAGLATGVIEGLRDSDLAANVANFLVDVFTEAVGVVTQQVSLGEAFSNVFESPIKAAIIAVGVIITTFLGVRLVRGVATAFGAIARTMRGFGASTQALRGNLQQVDGAVRKSQTQAMLKRAELQRLRNEYGLVGAAAVRMGDNMNRIVGRIRGTATQTQVLATSTARFVTDSSGVTREVGRMQGGFRNLVRPLRDSVRGVEGMNAGLGGLMAGGGIAAAINADDPVGKLTGITIGISGAMWMYQAFIQAMRVSTIAGVLTGGIGVAVLALSALAGWFASTRNEAEQAAQATEEMTETLEGTFKRILDETGGNRAAAGLAFFEELETASGTSLDAFKTAVDELGFDLGRASRAITGTRQEFDAFEQSLVGNSAEIMTELKGVRDEMVAIEETMSGQAAIGFEYADQERQLQLLEAQRLELEEQLKIWLEQQTVVGAVREAYEAARGDEAIRFSIQQEMNNLERERLSEAQKVRDVRRQEAQAADDARHHLRESLNIDKERREQATKDNIFGQVNTLLEGLFPEEGQEIRFKLGLDDTDFSNTAINTRRAIESITESVGDLVADIATASSTNVDFFTGVLGLREQFEGYLAESGLTEGQIADLMREIFDPLIGEQNPFTATTVAMVEEGLETLKNRLEDAVDAGDLNLEFVGAITDENKREILETFIDEPAPVNFEPLLDLGVPKELLDAFVNDPNNTTLAFLVATIGADESFSELVEEAKTAGEAAGEEAAKGIKRQISKELRDSILEAPANAGPAARPTARDALGLEVTVNPPAGYGSFEVYTRERLGPVKTSLEALNQNIEVEILPEGPNTKQQTLNDLEALEADLIPLIKPDLPPGERQALERTIREVAEANDLRIKIRWDTTELGPPPIPRNLPAWVPWGRMGAANSEHGRVVTAPMLTWVGEKHKKEVIIPLTKPERAAQLYRESGLDRVLAKAGVGTAGGSSTVVVPNSSTQTDAKLGTVINELRGLRHEIQDYGSDTYIVESRDDPRLTADAVMRRRRRARMRMKNR